MSIKKLSNCCFKTILDDTDLCTKCGEHCAEVQIEDLVGVKL